MTHCFIYTCFRGCSFWTPAENIYLCKKKKEKEKGQAQLSALLRKHSFLRKPKHYVPCQAKWTATQKKRTFGGAALHIASAKTRKWQNPFSGDILKQLLSVPPDSLLGAYTVVCNGQASAPLLQSPGHLQDKPHDPKLLPRHQYPPRGAPFSRCFCCGERPQVPVMALGPLGCFT